MHNFELSDTELPDPDTIPDQESHPGPDPLVSWCDPRWEGLCPAPPKKHNHDKLTPEQVTELLTAGDAALLRSIDQTQEMITDGLPDQLPDPTDTASWTLLAQTWASRNVPLCNVWISRVPMPRSNSTVHVDRECPGLRRASIVRWWAGHFRMFTNQRLCVTCFPSAPRNVTAAFALEMAARRLHQHWSLKLVRQGALNSLFVGRRTECVEDVTYLRDAATLLADLHPRVAEVCRAAADAFEHAYNTEAQKARATGLDPSDLVDTIDASVQVAEKMSRASATVTISGPGWATGHAHPNRTGAVYDLGKASLTWETTAATAVYLMYRKRRCGNKWKLQVVSDDPVFSTVLDLSGLEAEECVDNWPVAEAVLA